MDRQFASPLAVSLTILLTLKPIENMSGLFRLSGLGRALYLLYYRPVGWARSLFAHGGPWTRRKTLEGQRAMEAAVPHLPPPEISANTVPLTVHLLTGTRFWYQTAFCLHSFSTQSGRPLAPVIYDDGSLTAPQRDQLARLFPSTRFVARAESNEKLERLLPYSRFPVLRERWDNYPNLRKLTDPHLGAKGWKLVMDSDLLFFRKPDLLTAWADSPSKPLHAVDVANAYGYSDALLASLCEAPLPQRLNVGLCGLRSEDIDWEKIEFFSRTLIAAERTNYYLEQALVAVLLAGRECTVANAADYLTLPQLPEALSCEAIMHHYVADSKRWYFQHNWRRCVPTPSA